MAGEKKLMCGAHAMGLGAMAANCRYFAGYPITPQTELLEYMSQALPAAGGIFQQLNDEISSIMACFGASASGARVMTASVGPGLTLMIDGLANAAGAELPMVVGVLTRAHVGVSAGLLPAQSDIRMLKGGGNGDYHLPIYAPSSCQEAAQLTYEAFDLADRYKTPVFVAIDGFMSNMMEVVGDVTPLEPRKYPYRASMADKGASVISSYMTPDLDTHTVYRLAEKYQKMQAEEARYEAYQLDDAQFVIVAFGIMARVAKEVVLVARQRGIKVGLFRPITLYPFAEQALREVAANVAGVLVTEMNMGQILTDVRLAVEGRCPIDFCGHPAKVIPPAKLLAALESFAKKEAA
ncbi:MAG: 3-methyl-2-oxobutanoate dehydrogenase subunit beta [Deltaproteobacteria bacterium]|nr:3-methyl-2-oxobutanoate dehydrogenase subunit beta [Deltaproteobacteria bacterium]